MAKNRFIIYQEIFYFLSSALIIAVILEIIWPRMVLAYFNLNYLLILWLMSALILLFNVNKK